jgi:hypothetical protein
MMGDDDRRVLESGTDDLGVDCAMRGRPGDSTASERLTLDVFDRILQRPAGLRRVVGEGDGAEGEQERAQRAQGALLRAGQDA